MAAEGWERRVARPQHPADRLTPPPCCSWRGSGGTSGGRLCSLLSSASSPDGFCSLCPCTPSLCSSSAISWLTFELFSPPALPHPGMAGALSEHPRWQFLWKHFFIGRKMPYGAVTWHSWVLVRTNSRFYQGSWSAPIHQFIKDHKGIERITDKPCRWRQEMEIKRCVTVSK